MARLFDVLLGRTKPVQANLDQLFGLVGAQITLQAAQSLLPSGQAGICYKAVAGRSFAETAGEASQLLGIGDPSSGDVAATSGKPTVRQQDDKYGYHWIILELDDFQSLVNEVHLVNSTLQDNGYGPQLLCSVFGFRPDPAAPAAGAAAGAGTGDCTYLVYLYKRGAFYPFVPLPGAGERRDLEREMVLQKLLADDLAIEADKERWMALWGLPVH
jgi:hypothetical protein